MPTQLDIRQSVYRSALNMAGTGANATVDGIIAAYDPEIGKLFEDRNILLTDGGLITFTGTAVQFTENLNITLNQKISGAVPQVINLGSSTQNFTSNGDMLIAVLNRTAGTATLSIVTSGNPLSAVSNANQEVFIIAKRVDAGDGTQRLYWRNGFAQNAGQTLRLGQGGGSGGNGTGSDLGTLQFRAQFLEQFPENAANSVSAVNGTAGFTNATYSAAKSMYTLNYDAAHTANSTGTAVTVLTSVPGYTVVAGDVVVNLATNEVKKITVVTDQQHYTIESAFATNMSGQAICISQCVHTKDIYNYAGSGAAISAAFSSSAFSAIMVDYEDNATSNSNLWTPNTTPFVAFSASTDNSNWTSLQVRRTNETDIMQEVDCPTSTAGLYIRFFSDKTSGSGFVNLITYEAFMQKALGTSQGSIQWAAYGVTNNSTTPINCTVATTGGKTTITLTNGNQYPVGLNSGQSQGALDVYVNGTKLPRFVSGSTPAADGYYTEASGTIIQLDKDYSSMALDFEVVYRVQIIDSSTQNTTNIAAINTSGLKNYLINGAFDIWQRNLSPTNTIANGVSTYVPDRWYGKNSLGTNGVLTMSQVAGTLQGSKYGCSLQITTAPTAAQANGTEMYQVIENANSLDLIGTSISFSVWIKALGLVNQVGIQFAYATTESKPSLFFGTEQLVTVNTSSFSIGSLLAQNSGTLPTSSGVIGVRIRITGVSSGQLYALNNGFVVEQACVNLGGTAIAFTRQGRSFADELDLCQRYFETLGSSASANRPIGMGVCTVANTTAIVLTPFKVQKRVNAVGTVSGTGAFTLVNATINTQSTNIADAGCGVDSGQFTVTFGATLAANAAIYFLANGTTSRFYFDSEI